MRILIGLSGGLDSTYAAYLLKSQGHEVVGASVLMHSYTDTASAEKSAEQVGIPFVKIDGREAFKSRVVDRFIRDYMSGMTPNPCVECNPFVKFGALCNYAEKNGFDKVATGHYALVGCENGRYYVRSDQSSGKDQSYVLWKLTQKQLSMLYLPLNGMDKAIIRQRAAELGFSAAESKESQDICFIPDGDYAAFLMNETKMTFPEGDFVDAEGNVIGRHKGIINYTVGQRKGLGAFGRPMFVKSIDPDKNTVTIVPSGEEYMSRTLIRELNFMKQPEITDGSLEALCRVRYSSKPVPCRVEFKDGGAEVFFEGNVRAVTPGQSAVFYDGDGVLFGGIIIK